MIRTALIEDDDIVRKRLAKLIAHSGDVVLVASAATHAEGIELIKAGGYEVLMCDLGLPDGPGLELIRLSMDKHPKVPVIVVTMFADHRKVVDCLRMGAKGYLLKDENLEDCVPGIREVMRGGSPINPFIARKLLERFHLPQDDDDKAALSERELQVLRLLARGYAYAEIGSIMGVTTATVGTYVKRLYRKLQVGSRAEAVFEGSHKGLLGDD